ncbi:MAG: hypothetical protein J2P36_05765 [Ktedonobacteraceae bacterium]|nr:hypothetical protein [Ktedonobacteraceae bacterium]
MSGAQPASNLNKGVLPDTLSRTTVDGVAPQPSSVAIDHEYDDSTQTATRPVQPEHTEQTSSGQEDVTRLSTITPIVMETGREASLLEPSPQQRLEFFRYLVDHGFIDEGFKKGQVPGQYRRCPGREEA